MGLGRSGGGLGRVHQGRAARPWNGCIEWAETQELARLQAQMQGVQLGRKAAAVGGKILEMPLVERAEEGITCECGRKHPQTVHPPHPDVKISDAPDF